MKDREILKIFKVIRGHFNCLGAKNVTKYLFFDDFVRFSRDKFTEKSHSDRFLADNLKE